MLTLAEIRGKGREGLPKKQTTAYITMSMKITNSEWLLPVFFMMFLDAACGENYYCTEHFYARNRERL